MINIMKNHNKIHRKDIINMYLKGLVAQLSILCCECIREALLPLLLLFRASVVPPVTMAADVLFFLS